MIESALKYHSAGLSVIPVDEKKVPISSWSRSQKELVQPNGQFNNCYGIGVVCGAVSGNLECIDIDVKYDLNGTLFADYCELIKASDESILPKLLVEKTQKNGYHFFYRCAEISGNTKLANRYCTDEEKKLEPHQKVKVLIETRGEGGYVMVFPSPKYTLARGDFSAINEITPQQRKILFDCAKALNQVYEKPNVKPEYKPTMQQGVSVFEDYNARANVLELLLEYGWTVKRQRGQKYLMLRPGGEGMWSADYDESKRLFFVFTTSSEFENGKAFNPSQVLTILRFKGDYSASSKWMRDNGYGTEKAPHKAPVRLKIEQVMPAFDEVGEYLETVRNGTFKLGLTTGIPKFDEYFRLKPNSLVIINGHDGVGKSVVLWYFAVLSAINHGWTWVIHAAENKTGGVYRKLIEFYTGKAVKGMDNEELSKAKEWVYAHFTVLSNKETFTYMDILEISDKLLPRNAVLIDPFNSLFRDKSKNDNVHDYDYECLGEMRTWINTRNCSIYINCHAVTEALRRVYPKGHIYEGYPMPPNKADTEGGGKFSNRADDFITIHRMNQHPNEWMWTELHVRKIKEMETGGRPTFYESPFKIRMIQGGIGFEDADGYNARLKKTNHLPFNEPEQDQEPPF